MNKIFFEKIISLLFIILGIILFFLLKLYFIISIIMIIIGFVIFFKNQENKIEEIKEKGD